MLPGVAAGASAPGGVAGVRCLDSRLIMVNLLPDMSHQIANQAITAGMCGFHATSADALGRLLLPGAMIFLCTGYQILTSAT